MHEFIEADRVLRSVLDYMYNHGLSVAQEVDVDVGELLGLQNESLSTAFHLLSKGTPAERCKLKIRRVKGSVVCSKCGYTGNLKKVVEHVVHPAFACPNCGNPVIIKAGNELRIRKVS